MNALQYLMLGMSAFSIVYSPFLIAKAVRRKQKYRLFEIPVSAAVVIYITVLLGWPKVIDTSPPIVHLLLGLLLVLGVANCFGLFRWLFNRRKAIPVERS